MRGSGAPRLCRRSRRRWRSTAGTRVSRTAPPSPPTGGRRPLRSGALFVTRLGAAVGGGVVFSWGLCLRRFLRLEPRHHLAQATAGDFDGVLVVGFIQPLEVLHAAFVFGPPFLGELAGL